MKEEKQVETFQTETHQIVGEGALGRAKQGSFLLLEKLKLQKRQKRISESYGPLPVVFSEEFMFQVAPTTVTLLRKSTYKIAVRLSVNVLHFQPRIFLLDKGLLDLASNASLK